MQQTPKFPTIIQTPNHFYIDSIDLLNILAEPAEIERLDNGKVIVNVKIIADSYTYQSMSADDYDFNIQQEARYTL